MVISGSTDSYNRSFVLYTGRSLFKKRCFLSSYVELLRNTVGSENMIKNQNLVPGLDCAQAEQVPGQMLYHRPQR